MKAAQRFACVLGVPLTFSVLIPVTQADISASAGAANIYLWRGIDLSAGQGTPAISGSLTYSSGGLYSTIWGSSGDATNGTEYDVAVGYGGSAGAFSYGISIWNYLYPTGNSQEDQFGDLSEVVLSLSLGPASFSWYENVATNGGDETYRYYTLGVSQGAYRATVGASTGDASAEYIHVDLSYAYNDNLRFTLSQVIDDDEDAVDDDLNFVVSYSFPIQ